MQLRDLKKEQGTSAEGCWWGRGMNDMRRDELNRMACGWLGRGGIVAEINARCAYTVNNTWK